MTTLRFNNVHARLATALDDNDTTIDLDVALTEGGVNVPTLSGGDVILLGIEDEVVELTAYTAGATTGTITREYGDTAAVPHDAGTRVANVITKEDVGGGPSSALLVANVYNTGNISVSSTAYNGVWTNAGLGLVTEEVEDTDWIDWDESTGRLTYTVAGFYMVRFSARWQASAASTGGFQVALIAEAGGNLEDTSLSRYGPLVTAHSTDIERNDVDFTGYMPAGSYHVPSARQTTGSSRNIAAGEIWARVAT